MVADMKEKGNPNSSKTEAAVTDLNKKLDKIIEGASEVVKGAEGSELIGNIDSGVGAVAEPNGINSLIEGISKIVEVVLKDKGNPEAGDDKQAADGSTGRGANAGEAGKLFGNTGGGNIDNAVAVALKAMTKDGKFVQPASREEEPIKASAVSAVNKVLGVLDEIIRKTVSIELGKIKDAVKEIKYSETNVEATEAKK